MRTIGQVRNSGTTRTRDALRSWARRFGVLAATLGLGVAASGRASDHYAAHIGATHIGAAHSAAHTTADTTTTTANDYSGGRLMTADPNGGYWTVNWVGAVTSYGGAPTFGSPAQSGITVAKPIVAMAATPDGQGYWLVGSDGGVFAYGDANFYGSTGAIHLNDPIVGMAATPDGLGYWLVASDGGIFTYGDAAFYGSTGAIHLNEPIVGMAPTPDGQGYWLVASDGGIFTYGDAAFYGSTGAIHLNEPIVGMAPTPDGLGVLAGGVRRRHLHLRRRHLRRVHGRCVGARARHGHHSLDRRLHLGRHRTAWPRRSPPPLPPRVRRSAPLPMPIATPDALQGSDCQPTAAAPTATVDTALNSLIANQTGPGWVGGDATYSTQLPDGQRGVRVLRHPDRHCAGRRRSQSDGHGPQQRAGRRHDRLEQ